MGKERSIIFKKKTKKKFDHFCLGNFQIQTLSREIQGEHTHLNTIRSKYKTLSSDLTNQERQQAEEMMNKIEVHIFTLFHSLIKSFLQVELEQLHEQLEKRKERLNALALHRQELDQLSDRLNIWYEDKQRLISTDQTIPLKTAEIERIQKKYSVNYHPSFLIKS